MSHQTAHALLWFRDECHEHVGAVATVTFIPDGAGRWGVLVDGMPVGRVRRSPRCASRWVGVGHGVECRTRLAAAMRLIGASHVMRLSADEVAAWQRRLAGQGPAALLIERYGHCAHVSAA